MAEVLACVKKSAYQKKKEELTAKALEQCQLAVADLPDEDAILVVSWLKARLAWSMSGGSEQRATTIVHSANKLTTQMVLCSDIDPGQTPN